MMGFFEISDGKGQAQGLDCLYNDRSPRFRRSWVREARLDLRSESFSSSSSSSLLELEEVDVDE